MAAKDFMATLTRYGRKERVDRQLLTDFLDKHASTMPRTTLRYAIEHLPPEQRQHYLAMKDRA